MMKTSRNQKKIDWEFLKTSHFKLKEKKYKTLKLNAIQELFLIVTFPMKLIYEEKNQSNYFFTENSEYKLSHVFLSNFTFFLVCTFLLLDSEFRLTFIK